MGAEKAAGRATDEMSKLLSHLNEITEEEGADSEWESLQAKFEAVMFTASRSTAQRSRLSGDQALASLWSEVLKAQGWHNMAQKMLLLAPESHAGGPDTKLAVETIRRYRLQVIDWLDYYYDY